MWGGQSGKGGHPAALPSDRLPLLLASGAMTPHPRPVTSLLLLVVALLIAAPATAMPGFFVGKRDAKRTGYAAHIVLMKNDRKSVVTVTVDYEGPFEPFAFVMPVPADVTLDRILVLKRDAVDRLEQLTSPRVHHFWEKDPCALGKARQIWERHLKVAEGSGMQLFSGGLLDFAGTSRKVPRELSWRVEPDLKTGTGEYTLTLLAPVAPEQEEAQEQEQQKAKPGTKPADKAPQPPTKEEQQRRKYIKWLEEKKGKRTKEDQKSEEDEQEPPAPPPATELAAWLRGRGYRFSAEAEKAIRPYIDAGMGVLVAEVDHRRIELIGGDRAQLAPIRYYTDQSVTTFPVKLGLLNLDQAQELIIYVIHRSQRFEAANYKSIFPPTNIHIRERLDKIWVQERIGEIYASIHDRLAAKHPGVFLSEYAWDTESCGEPCPAEPLLLYELLGLGGEVLDLDLTEEERYPAPPQLSEEEEEALEAELEALEPKDRKDTKKARERERWEVARRQALAARHKYVLSRVHARYDRNFLKRDVEVRPASPVVGGGGIPKGSKGQLPTDIKPAKQNKLQVRFVTLHPWIGIIKCEKPVRWRWGEEWFSVRRLNKIWIADDLSRRQRGRTKLEDVVLSPVPEVGIFEVPEEPVDAGAEAGAEPAEEVEDSGCGCRLGAASSARRSRAWELLLLLGAAALLRTRRRDRR
jgi:hypothetical protein